jgi:hypothetical protein
MNVELVAQMFKNYQSNVLFHLEGMLALNIGFVDHVNIFQQRIALKSRRDMGDPHRT